MLGEHRVAAESRFEFTTLPLRTCSPSTDPRPGTWWGTIPSRSSNEWFSIITTTMCSISGMLGVPAGLFGNGRLSGWRRPAANGTGRAHAGSPRVASSAAPPAAAPQQ